MLVLLLLAHLMSHVAGQTAANVKSLKTQLLVTDDYDPEVRPTDNQAAPTGTYSLTNHT